MLSDYPNTHTDTDKSAQWAAEALIAWHATSGIFFQEVSCRPMPKTAAPWLKLVQDMRANGNTNAAYIPLRKTGMPVSQ
jgi:hypothetical protein